MAEVSSIQEVEDALKAKAAGAWDSVKAEWDKDKPAVEEYLQSGKKLVVGDDGKIDLTPLGDKIRDFGAAIKEKGIALWNDEEEGGIAGFFSKNKGGLIAGVLAVIIGMGLGEMGLIGALLLGALAFAVVGGMSDKNGVLSGLFKGGENHPPEGGHGLHREAGGPAQSQTIAVEHDGENPNIARAVFKQGTNYDVVLKGTFAGTDDKQTVTFDRAVIVDKAGHEIATGSFPNHPVIHVKNGNQVTITPEDVKTVEDFAAKNTPSAPAQEQHQDPAPAAQPSSAAPSVASNNASLTVKPDDATDTNKVSAVAKHIADDKSLKEYDVVLKGTKRDFNVVFDKAVLVSSDGVETDVAHYDRDASGNSVEPWTVPIKKDGTIQLAPDDLNQLSSTATAKIRELNPAPPQGFAGATPHPTTPTVPPHDPTTLDTVILGVGENPTAASGANTPAVAVFAKSSAAPKPDAPVATPPEPAVTPATPSGTLLVVDGGGNVLAKNPESLSQDLLRNASFIVEGNESNGHFTATAGAMKGISGFKKDPDGILILFKLPEKGSSHTLSEQFGGNIVLSDDSLQKLTMAISTSQSATVQVAGIPIVGQPLAINLGRLP